MAFCMRPLATRWGPVTVAAGPLAETRSSYDVPQPADLAMPEEPA